MSSDAESGSGWNGKTEFNAPLVLHRIAELEEFRREMSRLASTLSENQTALRLLISEITSERKSLHETTSHCVSTLAAVDQRIRQVEDALPLLQQTSKWVHAGVIGIVGLLGVATVNLLFHYREVGVVSHVYQDSHPDEETNGRRP